MVLHPELRACGSQSTLTIWNLHTPLALADCAFDYHDFVPSSQLTLCLYTVPVTKIPESDLDAPFLKPCAY